MINTIRDYREKTGMSQVQLAKKLGLSSVSIISMWETGARSPRIDKLPLLAKIFDCTIDDLFCKEKKLDESPPA